MIWEESPQTLKDILIKLNNTGWSTTTIQTYLTQLVKKKALITDRKGKGYLYYPAISESECLLEESKHFLHRIYVFAPLYGLEFARYIAKRVVEIYSKHSVAF